MRIDVFFLLLIQIDLAHIWNMMYFCIFAGLNAFQRNVINDSSANL